MMSIRFVFIWSLVLSLAGMPVTTLAKGEHPLEPANTASPRDTLKSFITACEEAYELSREAGSVQDSGAPGAKEAVRRALSCMDMSEIASFMRYKGSRMTALHLKEVLDRVVLPREKDIPGIKEVEAAKENGGLDYWVVPKTEIVISRVQEGPRTGEYLFSRETIEQAKEFYGRVKHLPYQPGATENLLTWQMAEPSSEWLRELVAKLPYQARGRILGQSLWQWVGLIISVTLALILMVLVFKRGRRLAIRDPQNGPVRYLLTVIYPIAGLAIPLMLGAFIEDNLNLSGTTYVLTKLSTNVIALLAGIGVVFALGKRITELIVSNPKIIPNGVDAQLIRLICRLLTMATAVIIFLEGGKYLGIPMSTLLAGAGVGGVALALGAQDAIKNIVGSMMIMLDKPYGVGERIIVSGHDGAVEEIGLRSTRIRLLTGHLTTIPNEKMATSDIENVGRRPHIRRSSEIRLELQQGSAKAERAREIVAELLKDHEGQKPDFPPRVFLADFARDHLTLKFLYWYHPPNYWDFCDFGDGLNRQIMSAFEKEGIRFAMPMEKTLLAGSPGEKEPIGVKIETA